MKHSIVIKECDDSRFTELLSLFEIADYPLNIYLEQDTKYGQTMDVSMDGANFGSHPIDPSQFSTEIELATHIVSMFGLWGVHEAMEMLLFRNERPFQPHPPNDTEAHEFLLNGIKDLVKEYNSRWPRRP